MVTIRDVARKANVAPSTVSMVINGRGRVSTSTRQRIEAAMRDTRYQRRSVGRPAVREEADAVSVATQVVSTRSTTDNIAVVYARRVVLNGQMCGLGRQWIAGIREVALQAHCHLTLTPAVEDSETDEMFQQALSAGEIHGAIFIGITGADGGPYLSRTLDARVPAVVFNRMPMHGEFSYIAMDNHGAGAVAADHLVKLGHRRIALIHLDHPDRRYAVELRSGAEAGVARHDLSPMYTGRLTETASDAEIADVCSSVVASEATAVYLGVSDSLVVRCINAWDAMGMKIPEQLSVVGFEDVGPKSVSGLRPTSIGFDKKFMGREAARMLLEMIRGGEKVRSRGLVVGTYLAEHDTTAVAPGTAGNESIDQESQCRNQ